MIPAKIKDRCAARNKRKDFFEQFDKVINRKNSSTYVIPDIFMFSQLLIGIANHLVFFQF